MTTSKYILVAVMSGITGTTIMTAFMLILRMVTRRQLNVITILGTMLTGSTTADGKCVTTPRVLITGTIAHYFVGIFFSFVYLWLWNNHIVGDDWWTTTILGFVTGLVGIAVWRTYFYIHRHPPQVPLRIYLAAILLAHVIFAWGVKWG